MNSRRLLIVIPFLMMLAFSSITTYPATWYVSPSGDNTYDCLDPSTPCRTIQAAIVKANNGDYLSIAAGTYSSVTNGEAYPINIDKSLNIFGKGADLTILDASASGQNVFHANGCLLDIDIYLFTIQGGNRGIEFIGDHVNCITGNITQNKILSNSTGIYFQNTDMAISLNDISFSAIYGIYSSHASGNITQNSFAWNGNGTSAAIYNDYSNIWMINNVIGWNNGSGVENNQSNPTITNNTIAYNYGGSGIANWSSSPTLVNNIVVGNAVYGIHQDGTSTPTKIYNDVWGNVWGDYFGTGGGTGSISADPRFVSAFDGHLRCSSPAINAGTSNGAYAVPSKDFDNNPRPAGGFIDMGAYERQKLLYCGALLPFVTR